MRFIKYICLLYTVTFFLSCGSSNSKKITGMISNAENMNVYFDKSSLNNSFETIVQGKTDATGKFEIDLPNDLPIGFYKVRIGAKGIEMIFDGSEKTVELNGELNNFAKYDVEVKGSEKSATFLNTVKEFAARKLTREQLMTILNEDGDPMVSSLLALRLFGTRPEVADIHKTTLTRLKESYPDLSLIPDYEVMVSTLMKQKNLKSAQAKIKVGMEAPEISMANPDGKIMKLSDLRGQIVLIDFWASWCGPCRKANPKVVDVYQRYKDKGFTVYSVSLDGLDSRTKARFNSEQQIADQTKKSKERWLAAIEKDNLIWDSHVSDLKKWESLAAAEYGVRSIPQTFLVDKDGKIAAVNPRNDLEAQVKKLL